MSDTLKERLTEHLARNLSESFCVDSSIEGYGGFEAVWGEEGEAAKEELIQSCMISSRKKAERMLEEFDWGE